MTVLVSIASKSYPAGRDITSVVTVPAGTKRLRCTLTRENWPAGDVGSLQISWPDGTLASANTFQGGHIIPPLTGVEVTIQVVELDGLLTNNVQADLPAGDYTANAHTLQALTTSVTVEAFSA